MPEGLSLDDDERAKSFVSKEKRESRLLDGQSKRVEAAKEQYDQRDRANITDAQSKTRALQAAERGKSETEDRRDANLWRAQQHFKEHEEGYKEQAVIDAAEHLEAKAEAEGKDPSDPDFQVKYPSYTGDDQTPPE